MKMKSPTLDGSIGYIIDCYSPYNKNENVVKTFRMRGQTLCIRTITKFKWGQPLFPEKDIEDDYTYYKVYDTLEEAEQYVRELKQLEGINI